MKSLENKIPPLIIVVFFLVLIFLLKNFLEVFTFSYQVYISFFFLCLAVSFFLTSIIEFRKHKTTLNPLMPEESTTLVTTGVFKLSRNPIYLSLLNLLIAFSIYLGSFLGLFIIPLFVIYMNLFQIEPEEKAMLKLYGKEFENYCSKVRRWI
tara:strand:- start:131 stop:586 length:456 start_codon:yes stop_codon:yes gene_type:complete